MAVNVTGQRLIEAFGINIVGFYKIEDQIHELN